MTRLTLTGAAAITLALSLFECGGSKDSAKSPDDPELAMAPAEKPPLPPEPVDAGSPLPSGPPQTPAAVAAKAEAPKPDTLTDEQIAAVTDAVNSAEIEQAKLAQLKSKNPNVKRLSAMMLAQHSEAKKAQDKLKLGTADSTVSTALGTDAASTLATLKKAEGKEFDDAYVTAQVNGHRKVLETIDGKLLPNVKNPDLKAYLNDIRPKVAHHLKEAEQLQTSVATKTAPGAAAKTAE